MRVGSLCSGYGGLELAVETLWSDAEVVWHAEVDPHASQVLARHWPGTPNHGDLTTFDWTQAEPVVVVTAGYPCQPFSTAGRRGGESDARHIWPHVLRAVRHLRPRLVLLENVSGHLSLGFGRVLGDLAEAGYDARWTCLRAADIGAPHRRERLFVLAYPDFPSREVGRGSAGPGERAGSVQRSAADSVGSRRDGRTEQQRPGRRVEPADSGDAPPDPIGGATQLRRGPRPVDRPPGEAAGERHQRQRSGHPARSGSQTAADTASGGRDRWPQRTVDEPDETERLETVDFGANGDRPFGAYQPAIDRWANTLGRPAPPGLHNGRLNERFVEWMMGLPDGWVTDLVARRHALRILGNGVVPQQAAAAYRQLLTEQAAAA